MSSLYKRAESDAEFVRSLMAGGEISVGRLAPRRPEVVDGYSCRQKFLRSYTFSKEETVPEKAAKCFGKVPCNCCRLKTDSFSILRPRHERNGRRSLIWGILRRLLLCVASIDAIDRNSVIHAL